MARHYVDDDSFTPPISALRRWKFAQNDKPEPEVPEAIRYHQPAIPTFKPKYTIGVDYHGVLCRYRDGKHWEADKISPDIPNEGAISWLLEASKSFHVAVTCARAALKPEVVGELCEWLVRHGIPRECLTLVEPSPMVRSQRIWVARFKPRCWLYIDDRAYCFEGTFPSVNEIERFRPWNRR